MITNAVKRLTKHSVIYALGPALQKLISFALLPFVTLWIGSTGNYGVLEIASVTIAVAGQVLGSNLLYGMARFHGSAQTEREKSRVVTTTLWLLLVTNGAALVTAVLLRVPLSALLFEAAGREQAFVVIFLILFCQSIGLVGLRYLQILEQSALYGVLTTLKMLVEIGLKIWFLLEGFEHMGALYSVLGGEALVAALLSLWIVRKNGLGFDRAISARLWRYSTPLIVSGLCMFVLHQVDRYFLQHWRGEAEVGLYALAYKLGSVANALIVESFGLIWYPFVFALQDEQALVLVCRKVATYFTLVMTFGTLALWVLAEELVRAMADDKFFSAHPWVPIIAAAYLFWGLFQVFQTVFYLRSRTLFVSYLVGGAALVNLGLCAYMIPRTGAAGAAWATLVTFAALAGGAWFCAERVLPIRYEWKRMLGALLLALALALGARWIPAGWPSAVVLGVKVALLASFPVLLWCSGYLEPWEKHKIKAVWTELMEFCKSGRLGRKRPAD